MGTIFRFTAFGLMEHAFIIYETPYSTLDIIGSLVPPCRTSPTNLPKKLCPLKKTFLDKVPLYLKGGWRCNVEWLSCDSLSWFQKLQFLLFLIYNFILFLVLLGLFSNKWGFWRSQEIQYFLACQYHGWSLCWSQQCQLHST